MPIYPPQTTYSGPTASVPTLARPAYRATVTDPSFGTLITRVSHNSMPGGNTSQAIYYQHNYSKDQPWNSDMTLFKLTGSVNILNTSDWTVYRSWGFKNDSRWSTVNPDILYYVTGAQFRQVNVRTLSDTLIRTFSANIRLGPDEGNISLNDTMAVFTLGGSTTCLVYNMQTDTIVAQGGVGSQANDWMSVSSDGNSVLLSNNSGGGIQQRDLNLNVIRMLYNPAQHGDTGWDANGNPVYVQICDKTMRRLDNGTTTNLLTSWYQCGHLSVRNYARPGYATFGTNGGSAKEIYTMKLNTSGLVERFCHTRTSEATYDAQNKAVVSPDGAWVAWNSDWSVGTGGDGINYCYVARMDQSVADTTPPAAPTGITIN